METIAQKKLLIVEDEPMIRHAIVETFSQEKDIIVLAAKDGKEGLEAALHEHPDYILLDIVMPVMDGMQMLEALREDEWGKDAHVMFLSNLDDSEKMAEARAKGVYDFVIKSDMDTREVVKVVRKKLFGDEPAKEGTPEN